MSNTKPKAGAKAKRAGRPFQGTLSDIDLRLLRVFVAVAQCNGFAAAAARLGKGISAISVDLGDLEQRLSVRLCERGRAGFALTDEGREVLHAAQALFGWVDEFKERINSISGRLSGELTLYIINNLVVETESPLAKALERFSHAHPKVFVQIISASSADIEQALLQGQADIAITPLARERAGWVSHPLFEETLHLYCGKGHPLFGTPDDELDMHLINQQQIIATNSNAALELTGWDQPGFMFAARADSLDARAIAILSGAYLGILPDRYADAWVKTGQMRALCPNLIAVRNTFSAVLPSASSRLAARAFAAVLLDGKAAK